MAQKSPVRLNYDGSNLDGFAEFQSSDYISLADGGTGASYASLAALRTGIGLQIGTNVQAFDSDLTTLSGLTHADGAFIVSDGSAYTLESGSTARTSLGLGTGDTVQFTSLTLTGNLDVRGEVINTTAEVIAVDDAFVKLNTGNSEVDAGLIVETTDTNDARLFYDVSNNRWVLGENNSYDEILTQTSTDTITNKSISGSANTITNIGNSALSNSSFTVTDGSNSTAVALGGTLTFTGGAGVDIAESSGTLTFTADLSEILTDFNERVDDRVNAMATAGSNISLTYDDAAGTLTIASTDTQLSTEAVQDIVGAMFSSNTETNIAVTYDDSDGTIDLVADLLTEEAVEDFVNGMIVGGTNVTATYDDAAGTLTLAATDTNTQLTQEQVEDFVGGMLGGTQTFITVAYDDTNGDLTYVVPVKDEDNMSSDSATHLATQQSIKAYVDSQIQTEETIEDFVGGMVTGNTETFISVTYEDSDGTMDFVVPVLDEDNMSTNSDTHLATQQSIKAYVDSQIQTEETIEDFVGGMFSSNTETYITASYDDSDGTLDLVVPVLDEDNMSSDSSAHLATQQSIKAYVDSQVQTEESIEDFVGGMVTGNTETLITVTYDDSDGTMDFVVNNDLSAYDNSSSGFITATLTQEQVEDFVGGMLDGDETFITVAYDDTDGNIDFTVPVKDEDNMASDSASHLATQQSIKAYVDTQVTAQDLDFQADSGGALAIDLDSETITFTGGTGIDTSGSGNVVTFAIDSTVVTESSTDTLTNKTINFENNTAIVEYAVTVAGGKFVIDGESQATISFNPGITYRFDLSDSSTATHPFVLSTTSEGTAYTTGRTANGSQGSSGAYIEFTVNAATPDILYYYCSSHSGMGGTITVFGSSYGDTDARGSISVTDSGGDGSLAYNNSTGVITYTGPSAAEVRAHLSAGTGVTYSGGAISIGQAVATTSNVQFNNVQVDGVLTSNDITSTNISIDGNATITGNLTVEGTSTQVDSTTVTVADPLFKYAKDNTGNSVDIGFYGKYVQSATTKYAGLIWDASTSDKFRLFHGNQTEPTTTVDLSGTGHATGTLIANVEGDLTGAVTGNASTATALASGRTIGMTGDVVWTSASFDGSGNVTGTAAIQSDAVETAMVNANVISGQSAYSGSVDTTNDFVLIYDHSTTSLKKIAVSDLNSASGAGTMSSFTIAGDSGSNQVVANANTLTLTGGSGIDTSVGGTDEVTIAINTEAVQDIVGAMFTSNTETNISVTYEDGDGTIDLVSTDTQLTSEQVQDIVGAMFTGNTETNITATYEDSDGTIDLVASAGTVTEAFKTIAVSGQNNVVADSGTDTLTFAAGANITLTTDDSNDTVTIAATGGAANAFSTLAVSGQSSVVADAATDTLTLVAGTGMTLTTDAGADSITFTSAATGGGTMPFTEFDGSTDDIVLSSTSTAGSLPVTLAGGSSDPIAMTATTQTLTSYADADNDTKVEVERTTDNDIVHIKAGGTDVITATPTGVTITNLTVSGTTTQANELKITDTLFELNADGGTLTTDAGMIVERGSTGDNAAFIWDESADSWVAGTTATDGSASSNLTVTEGDLKAKTQNQSDNSTKVATTSYVDTALGSLSSNSITDADSDTKIQVEESSDEDIIRADTAGQERVTIDNNVSMSARGGFFTHNATLHASETFTIASTEGTVAAGPLDVQGTVDVQGTLVVV